MTTEELLFKLLPVLATAVSIVGGLALNKINERREAIRKSKTDNDAQELVNRMAADSQDQIKSLTARVLLLEEQGRQKDQVIAELEKRIDLLTGNTIEKEVDLDIDMG